MKTRLLLLFLAILVLAPAGRAQGTKPKKKLDPIDFPTYYRNLPRMKEISQDSIKSIYTLNELMQALGQTLDEEKAAGIRAQIRQVLIDHRAMKLEMIQLVDKSLLKGEAERTDLDALRALRNTQLKHVRWQNIFLKYVSRDIAQAVGVPIKLNAKVQELNQIEIYFPEISAEGVMNIICENFDLKWIIYGGEFVVLKKVGPNEGRFIEWEKKHGKVDWIGEDKAKTYEDLPVAGQKRKFKKLENMDLTLLNHNMTKIYILEGQSRLHEARLEELEVMAKILKAASDPKFAEEKYKRHKHTLHYLYMEREGSIEVWDVINKVLGDRLELPDDNAALRQLLSKSIQSIEWQNKDLEEALYDLGRLIDVPVEVELPPFVELTVSLSVENVTVETVINLICDIHPMHYSYVNGKLFFAHVQSEDD